MSVPEIQAEELKYRLDRGENLLLLDMRDEYEYEISNIGGHLIPLPELPKRFHELAADQEIVEVGTESAYRLVERLAREEGLLVSASSAAALHGCLDVAKRVPPETQAVIVTVFPDSAAKYLSERFWDEQ